MSTMPAQSRTASPSMPSVASKDSATSSRRSSPLSDRTVSQTNEMAIDSAATHDRPDHIKLAGQTNYYHNDLPSVAYDDALTHT